MNVSKDNITTLKRGDELIFRDKIFYFILGAVDRYGAVFLKATPDKHNVGLNKWTHEFNGELVEEIEIKEEDPIDFSSFGSVPTKVESLLSAEVIVNNEEMTDEEVEAARERIRQKSLDISGAGNDKDLGGIFTVSQSNDSANNDFITKIQSASVKTNEIVKPIVESTTEEFIEEGEISDYKFNNNYVRIIKCDSINSQKFGIKSLPNKIIDCAIIDAPYGMAFRSNTRKKETRHMKIKNDDNLNFVPEWLKHLNRVTKDDSFIYLFFSHHYIEVLVAEVKKVFGDGYKLILVWEKDNTTAGDLDSWGSQTEFILFIKKGSKALTSVRDGNILKFSKVVTDNHPTEKPLTLIQYLVKQSCSPGELLLDTFAGSGVLAEAALYEGCNAIVMEYEQKYYDYICMRIKEAITRPKLLMDTFTEGIENRTDKYIKIMEASYKEKLREEMLTQAMNEKQRILSVISEEILSGNLNSISHILKLI